MKKKKVAVIGATGVAGQQFLASLLEIELYSNEQIARWKKQGRLTQKGTALLRKKILSHKK
jgi:aspartate-semialdehyde dehydrogenase